MDEVGNTRWRIELPLPGMLGVPEEPDSVQSVISACSDPSATAGSDQDQFKFGFHKY